MAPRLSYDDVATPLRDSWTRDDAQTMAAKSARELAGRARELKDLYRRTGHVPTIERATRIARRASDAADDERVRAESLLILAQCLDGAFRATGDSKLLDDSVDAAREAVELADRRYARAVVEHHLANRLIARYRIRPDRLDLDEADLVSAAAVDGADSADRDWPSVLNTRALVLATLGRVDGAPELRAHAIDLLEEAVSREHADRPYFLGNLSNVLSEVARESRDAGQPYVDLLERSRQLALESLSATRRGTPDHVVRSNNAANRNRQMYEATGDLDHLREALRLYERSLRATPRASPYHAALQHNRALTLEDLGSAGDAAAVRSAKRAWIRALTSPSPRERVVAGKRLGRLAASTGDWEASARGWTGTIEAMRLAAELDILVDAKLRQVTRGGTASTEAALAYARAGRPEDAARWLDRGRAVVLAEALRRRGDEFVRLIEHGHRDLAQRYTEATDRRARAERSWRPAHPEALQALRQARQKEASVLSEIRAQPGFGEFAIDDRRPVPAPGTVHAYVAAGEHGTVVLLRRPDGEVSQRLLSCTREDVDRILARYRGAIEARRAGADDPAALMRLLEVIDETCRWCWVIVEAILGGTADREQVVLLPDGRLGLLPLHAAWTSGEVRGARRWAIDERVFSYAPTAAAAVPPPAPAKRQEPRGSMSLVIGDPRPLPAAARLPGAAHEGRIVARLLDAQPLLNEEATLRAVLDGLPHVSRVAHFACHGYSDTNHPLDSALLLAYGERLTVRDVRAMHSSAALGVLSACSTAVTGTDPPDEFLGLPVGLVEAGVGAVVASLWAVADGITAHLMEALYEGLLVAGKAGPEALRDAQVMIRDAAPSRLLFWAGRADEPCDDPVRVHDHTHPYWWAPFVWVGDPRPLVATRPPPD